MSWKKKNKTKHTSIANIGPATYACESADDI